MRQKKLPKKCELLNMKFIKINCGENSQRCENSQKHSNKSVGTKEIFKTLALQPFLYYYYLSRKSRFLVLDKLRVIQLKGASR